MYRQPAIATGDAAVGDGGRSSLPAVGGWLGIAESTLPFIAFTIVWTATGRDIVSAGSSPWRSAPSSRWRG